jgi:hypothetical protein
LSRPPSLQWTQQEAHKRTKSYPRIRILITCIQYIQPPNSISFTT